MNFIYSVNTKYDEKPSEKDHIKRRDIYNDWRCNFVKKRGTISDLYSYVSKGYGITHLFKDEYYHPDNWNKAIKKDWWLSSNLVIIDIDPNKDFPTDINKNFGYGDISNNKFINDYAALIFPSPSFDTKTNPYRWRIIFILENTNLDPLRHYHLQQRLHQGFKQSTTEATNIHMAFWGNKKISQDPGYAQKFVKIYPDKLLPDSVVDKLVKEWRGKTKTRTSPTPTGSTPGPTISKTTTTNTIPLASAPSHGEFISTDLRRKYEVLFKDDVIGGYKIESLKNQTINNLHCPFPHYHKDNDAKPSASLTDTGHLGPFLYCYGEGVRRYFVPPTYDELSNSKLKSVNSIDYRNEKYLDPTTDSPVNIVPGVNLVKSYMGSGKTEYLRRYVSKERAKGKKILIFSHLRSLAFSIADRVGGTCYLTKNYKPGNKATNVYVMSPYSLRNDYLEVFNTQWDIVIIDEFEQLLSGVLSGFTERENQISSIPFILKDLKYLLNNAETSILLDADLGEQTINFLNLIIPNPNINLIWNSYKPEKRKIFFHCSLKQLQYEILESYYNKEKFLFASNSKKSLDIMYQNFRGIFADNLNILLITKTTIGNDECKNFIMNPDKYCVNYDAIFYTPSLSTGVSIKPTTKHFDKVYGYFKNVIFRDKSEGTKTTTHLQNSQMLFRYRHNVPIHLFIEDESAKKGSWKNNYSPRELSKLDPSNTDYIIHKETMDDNFKFFNKFISKYYAHHRAYFKDTLGFDSEVIYPKQEDEEVGHILLNNIFNKTMFDLHYKGEPILMKEKKLSKSILDNYKLLYHLFKGLDFDLTTMKFNFNDEFVASQSNINRKFLPYCRVHQVEIEALFGIPFPANFETSPFSIVQELFKLLSLQVVRTERPRKKQPNTKDDIYKLV
jgi:hypothetical protein